MTNRTESPEIHDSIELEESKNILKIIFFRFIPYWPVFTVTIVLSLIIAYYYFHYQTPIYQAKSTILLKEDKESESQSNILEALNVFSSKKIVENELEVLKSRTLMTQVVTDLGLYAQLYTEGNLRDVLNYPSTSVNFIALYPEKLKNSGQIPFKYLPNENAILLNNQKYPVGSDKPVHTPYGDFKIQISPGNMGETQAKGKKPMYLQITSIKSLTKSLLGSLAVTASSKESSVIDLEIRDPNPQRAESILNDLMRVYAKAEIDDKNTTAANTLAFVEDRLKIVTAELSQVEGDIQHYKSKEGIVDISEEGKIYLSDASELDKKLVDVQIQLDVLDQVEHYVLKKGKQSGTVPAVADVTDPILKDLLSKLYDDELKLSEYRKFTGENSPSIVALKTQIDQLKPSILENLRALRQNFQSAKDKLQSDINKLKSNLRAVPQKERALLEISRQQFIKNSIYTYLLQKREETALAYASTVADSRIIDHAESGNSPVSPVASSIYLLALAVGTALPIIFVIAKEQYNSNVLFRSEIEKSTHAPIISEIIFDTSGDNIVIGNGKRTVIAEQFRSARTALTFLATANEKKVVLFTSSMSGEGKSFVAINLAVTLALTDKKVAIIELDLRKPRLSKILNIERKSGISDYLAGHVSMADIVKPVEDVPNLFLIPSGTIPPNPAELILNGRLPALLENLKKDFEWIIIDSPPAGLVTDAKLISVYADVTMYIIRHNYTPKVYLKMIEGFYTNNELKNLNIIFNGLKPRGVVGYGYGQGYGYGYGYGLGYGYDYGTNNGYTDDIAKGKFWKFGGLFSKKRH